MTVQDTSRREDGLLALINTDFYVKLLNDILFGEAPPPPHTAMPLCWQFILNSKYD